MRLTVTTFLSADGVYQGPGGPTEDPSGGFDRGGWLVPHFDEATGVFMTEVFQNVDAFLFGRKTFEIMAAHWPNVTDEDGDDTATRLNTLPKYVVSSTLRDPQWQNSTVVAGDIWGEVARLKQAEGGELQVHGSGALVRGLLEHDLVDELRLLVFPVIVGAGRRLFPETGVATALRLVESRSTPSGVVIQVYEPSGRPEFGTVPS